MSRAVLTLLGLAMMGLGLAALLRPVEMAAIVELPLPSAASRVDVRAMYGGLVMGLATFLLVCATRTSLLRIGSTAAACVFSGAALARAFGLIVEGTGQPLMLIVTMLEAMAAGLATWGAITAPRPVILVAPAPAAPLSSGDDLRSREGPFVS